MAQISPAVTLSVRISSETIEQLKELAEAIASYLEIQAWQVKSIQTAVKKANSKKTKFIRHQQVVDWVNSWDTDNELEIPK